MKAQQGFLALHFCASSFPRGVVELPLEYDGTIVVISKGPGSTNCEVAMPDFGGNRAPRASFSPEEADLNAYWGMRPPHARGLSPPKACLSRHVYLILLPCAFLWNCGPLGRDGHARLWW